MLALISEIGADPNIHRITVQLPLPAHADLVLNSVDPGKDVDGFHVLNVGLLGTGQKAVPPCNPLGCLMLLRCRLSTLSGFTA